MKKRNGASILIEALKKQGVDVVFGIPGGVVLHIFDAIYKSDLRFILARHEQGATHAADGYARSTGKVGVCLVTSGPGATNTITGLATAQMDSIPIVVITGQVATPIIGTDAFQEADVTGITRSISKHNYLVKSVEELPRVIAEAFHIAGSGRPGPVVVDLPKDVSMAESDCAHPEGVSLRSYRPTYHGHPRQIKRAAEAIAAAERPVVYAGGGVIISPRGAAELGKMVMKADLPVAMTLMGLGGYDGSEGHSLGMLGMHGTYYANKAVSACDLLIAVGARFDDRVTSDVSKFAQHARFIHIDIDPAAISKNVKIDIPIVGDAGNILGELNKILEARKRQDWWREISAWRKECPLGYKKKKGVIKPQQVVEELYRQTRGEAIITTEVGQNQMWAAQYYTYSKPRTFLSSGGLGTMGYGFPAAIGAQVGNPGVTVIDIAGDGSIQMNIQEMATAVQNKLPVKVAILDNSYLGMVRQWQDMFFGGRLSHTSLQVSPDWVALAEAYGGVGLKAEKPEEVRGVIAKALKVKDRPVLMDFIVDPKEDVYPMVPPGGGVNDIILGDK